MTRGMKKTTQKDVDEMEKSIRRLMDSRAKIYKFKALFREMSAELNLTEDDYRKFIQECNVSIAHWEEVVAKARKRRNAMKDNLKMNC